MKNIINSQIFEENLETILAFLSSIYSNRTMHTAQITGIKHLLGQSSITYHHFSKLIPQLNKRSIFDDRTYLSSLVDTYSNKGLKIIPAAGTSRDLLSFRIESLGLEEKQFDTLANAITQMSGFNLKKTLIINSYPTGITLPGTLNSIDCGAKPEVFQLALQTFGSKFQNFLLLCQPKLLRYLVQYRYLTKDVFDRFFIIVGGSWQSKNFEKLLAYQLGLDEGFVKSRILSLFGVAEIGLGIGAQTPQLSELRKQLSTFYPNLSPGIPSSSPATAAATPMVFALDINRFFIESIDGKILVTSLNPNLPIPIIRYATGDRGQLFLAPNSSTSDPASPNKYLFTIEGRRPDDAAKYPILEDRLDELLQDTPELFDHLTGNYIIKENLVIFEIASESSDLRKLEADIIRVTQLKCPIQFTTDLKYKNQIHTDLLRKPRVYE